MRCVFVLRIRAGAKSLVGALILMSLTSQVEAQSTGATGNPFDLSAIAGMLRPGGPAWQGRAAFPAAPGASARIDVGPHGRGDMVAEIEIAPLRTARLLRSVVVADATRAERTILAGAMLIARNGSQGEAYPNRPILVSDRGPLEWCLLDAEPGPLCIRAESASIADYSEMGGERRVWRGPMPELQEEPVTFNSPLTWRLTIAAIDAARGTSLESTIGYGEHRVRDRGFGFVSNGTGIDLGARYPGLRFRFLGGDGPDQVLIDAP